MKIRPVILCGGAGTRLWENSRKNPVKQFIDFGNWTLFGRTLDRVNNLLFDTPIISTNKKYIKQVKKYLKKHKIRKFKIIVEPVRKNTGPAILATSLIKEIPNEQAIVFLSSDHLIDKASLFNKSIKKSIPNLDKKNIFVFGIKPKNASDQFGYFLTRRKKKFNTVYKFIEKPKISIAKNIIKQNGFWNSGIFLARKDSLINNFKRFEKKIYLNCKKAVHKAKYNNNIFYLNAKEFKKNKSIPFDRAILEKSQEINAIKLNIPWSDLGSWREICLMFNKNKKKYFKRKNIFYKPWGKYINLFKGNRFLIKELIIKPKGILSLQKHFHRSEHWVIIDGKPMITLNKRSFIKKPSESIYIPRGAKHRICNPFKKPVKIIEAQIGTVLKESDIVRYQDIYGRVK
tara:strand:- start:1421 stop:2623 length:1203 start_codon:yes stop_codon:yes gene_type:complete